jgi:predicted Zn-dependent protease
VLLIGVAQAQERRPGQGVNFYSKDKEVALGQRLASDLTHQTTPLDLAGANDYVKRIGANLAAHFPGDWTYRIETVREDRTGSTHEPVAFPGGPIFVSLDLLRTAQTEAEFAGMLAHAMAHVASRHWTRSATKAELSGIASESPAALAFQRAQEREADYWAVKAMAAAGYDPSALASYLARVQDGPHQPRDERIHAIQSEVRKLPPATYSTGDEFARIQATIK